MGRDSRNPFPQERICVSSGSFAWGDLLIAYCHLLETVVSCTRDSDATAIKLSVAPPPNTTSSELDIPAAYGPTPFQTTPVSYYFLAFDPHGISHERRGLEERELFERRYQTEPSSYG